MASLNHLNGRFEETFSSPGVSDAPGIGFSILSPFVGCGGSICFASFFGLLRFVSLNSSSSDECVPLLCHLLFFCYWISSNNAFFCGLFISRHLPVRWKIMLLSFIVLHSVPFPALRPLTPVLNRGSAFSSVSKSKPLCSFVPQISQHIVDLLLVPTPDVLWGESYTSHIFTLIILPGRWFFST